ncbi:hypothetical protein PR048_006958 [Dryococelus australis]|uniref:Transmembrane protein n=1 Tax=Dryococelus australis TaxID=614101 RepID=A0ABQ9ICD8_9NEOP|nr:hypothetical protein PR048_006958 [Dryococelus australis]
MGRHFQGLLPVLVAALAFYCASVCLGDAVAKRPQWLTRIVCLGDAVAKRPQWLTRIVCLGDAVAKRPQWLTRIVCLGDAVAKRPQATVTQWLEDSSPANRQGEQGSIPGGVTPSFTHVEIVQDGAAGRRVFSGISRFPLLCIPALLHLRLVSPLSTLKTPLWIGRGGFHLWPPRSPGLLPLDYCVWGLNTGMVYQRTAKTCEELVERKAATETKDSRVQLLSVFILQLRLAIQSHFNTLFRRRQVHLRQAARPAYCGASPLLFQTVRVRSCGCNTRLRIRKVWLDYSFPTKTKWVRFLAGSPWDSRMRESCRTMPLVGGLFSGISRFSHPSIPALLHSDLVSPSSALKNLMLIAVKISYARVIRTSSASLDAPVAEKRRVFRARPQTASQFANTEMFCKSARSIQRRQRLDEGSYSAWCAAAAGGQGSSFGCQEEGSYRSHTTRTRDGEEKVVPRSAVARLHDEQPSATASRTAVAERFDCSPHTKANRTGFNPRPGQSLIFASKNRAGLCRWCRRVFWGISQFPLPLHSGMLLHSHLVSPSSALTTSLLRAAQISQLDSPRDSACVNLDVMCALEKRS